MRKTLTLLLLFITSLLTAQTVDTNHVDGVIYVKVKDTSSILLDPYSNNNSSLNNMITTYGIDSMKQCFPGINTTLDKTYRIYFNQIFMVDNLISDFQNLFFIEYAEYAPIYRTQATLIPDDIHQDQYWINLVEAPAAWDITTG